MLNDLKELITIPSVMGEPEDGAPFGKGPRAALDKFLQIAESYGMKTKNENGYCGWAEIGEGKDMLGILGHLDVVPASEGWSHPPYSLVCENGLIMGRGVTDDKGPTVAALHALKHIKESGKKLKHRFRLIVGCNEENGSQCIEYYRNHCEIPVASFVPDADFPVINSEKGILHLTLDLKTDDALTDNITEFSAGLRPNIVPDFCKVSVPKHSKLYDYIVSHGTDGKVFAHPEIATVITNAGLRIEDFAVHFFEDKLILESSGIAGHAMAPHKGENAVMKMIALLCGFGGTDKSATLSAIEKHLVAPNPASLLGIAAADEQSGELTVNLGMINLHNGILSITLDCRLPICADYKQVKSKILSCFPGGKLNEDRWSPNLYVPADSKLVSALLDAYSSVTGGEKKCLYCGGGTYARELPNAVAFGPTFEGLETNIHNIDESFPIELFDKLPEIYEAAILKLDEVF